MTDLGASGPDDVEPGANDVERHDPSSAGSRDHRQGADDSTFAADPPPFAPDDAEFDDADDAELDEADSAAAHPASSVGARGADTPTPHQRSWRHPSELARLAVTDGPRPTRRWAGAALVAGSLGLAGLAGLALVSNAGSGSPRNEPFRWLSNDGDQEQPNADDIRSAQRVRDGIVRISSAPALAVGTGVVIDGRGYILTSSALVSDSTSVVVELATGEVLAGRVIGTAAEHDLAVVKVSAPGLEALAFAPAPTGAVEHVLTVAAAPVQGAGLWLAVGPLSEPADVTTADLVAQPSYMDLGVQLPTIAVGAPVLDDLGRVLGLVHQSSATPVVARDVMPNMPSRYSPPAASRVVMAANFEPQIAQWIINDQGRAGWFGVTCVDFDGLANAGGLHTQGALVAAIESGSPSDVAGLTQGDIILQVNDIVVTDAATFSGLVRHLGPGDHVRLRVLRNGEPLRLAAMVVEAKAS